MEEVIIKVEEKDKEVAQPPIKKDRGAIGHFLVIVKEIVAVLFWIYVLTKLFVFDIDVLLIDKFLPNYAWLLNFKFFILIGTVAVIWLLTKNKHILFWSLYIFFYPAVIIFWKIPSFIFKVRSWIFAFAFFNAVISFFKSIKYNFITAALFLVSLAIIFGFSNQQLLWPAIAAVLVILSMIYVHRFILVFKPSSIFQVYIKIVSAIRKRGVSSFALDESIKTLPVTSLDQKQLEKRTTSLQTSVLFNRVCLFAAKKLRW